MGAEGFAATSDPNLAVTRGMGMENLTYELLVAEFPQLAWRAGSQLGQDWALVPAEGIRDVLRFLRTDARSDYRMLVDITAVDLLPRVPRWEVVYSLLSLSRNARYRLKVEIADVEWPSVPSVTPDWPVASFYERELYDLLGIQFVGHPDLRRLLLPDDWVGHPLRYDHPLGGEDVGFTS